MTSVLPAGSSQAHQPGGVRTLRTDSFLLLIADSDLEQSSQLADTLAEHQVTAIMCADGAEALLAAGAEHPDAVLVTATLPRGYAGATPPGGGR